MLADDLLGFAVCHVSPDNLSSSNATPAALNNSLATSALPCPSKYCSLYVGILTF